MTYARTAGQKAGDFADARAFENEVARHLPGHAVNRTNSTDQLDFYLPAIWLEVKEKKQKLTDRWWLLDGVPEERLFVLDELSLRKALRHGHDAWFLLHDRVQGNLWFANAIQVACAKKTPVDRNGKGKLIVDLQDFTWIPDLTVLHQAITQATLVDNLLQSACLASVGEVKA